MRIDEWTQLEEMFALGDAPSVEEFHQRLVLFPPVERNRSDAFEPGCLFRHYHETEKHGAATTAFLLVTDGRWRNATRRIMDTIATSGLIGDEDLDLLAQSFLAAERCLYWQGPEGWFNDTIEIVLEDKTDKGSMPADTGSAASNDGPIVIAREIRPPLRRWAAAHLVARDPAIWPSVLRRTEELDARNAAAAMRGLLDAIASLPEPAQTLLRHRAADWPQRDVRAAATALESQVAKSASKRPRSRYGAVNDLKALHSRDGAALEQERLF